MCRIVSDVRFYLVAGVGQLHESDRQAVLGENTQTNHEEKQQQNTAICKRSVCVACFRLISQTHSTQKSA